MKKQMFYPPLRDEFTKYGDRFEKIAHNEANGMYCYKRTTSEGLTYYEVFKAIRAMEPAWVKAAGGNFSLSEYKDSTGRSLPMYQLSKTECLYVANGFEAGRYRA